MSYQKHVTASFRVINKQSYSKINLTQLRPYSGDVSKVKVYFKTPGDVGGYKLLADSTLEAPEVLADPTIQFGRLKIGYIPKLTNRFTTIVGGNEYQTVNQLRRKPGVYSRKKRTEN